MSTHILPGQYAQSVQPNPKCEGCLHYDAQRGSTGVCLIGLKPWICGPGDAPDIGYAPIASARPHLPGSPVGPAQAGASGNDQASMAITETMLGDNQIDTVKGLIAEREALMKSACPLHSQHVAYNGQFALHSQVEQPCLCNPVTDYEIAKALVPLLTNAEREFVTAQELVAFVADVRAGFDPLTKSLSNGRIARRPHGDYHFRDPENGVHSLGFKPKNSKVYQTISEHPTAAAATAAANAHQSSFKKSWAAPKADFSGTHGPAIERGTPSAHATHSNPDVAAQARVAPKRQIMGRVWRPEHAAQPAAGGRKSRSDGLFEGGKKPDMSGTSDMQGRTRKSRRSTATLVKSDADDSSSGLVKGGEGSHGGHIIGHTKSGKPVYIAAHHDIARAKLSSGAPRTTHAQTLAAAAAHVDQHAADFTPQDHLDAAHIHLQHQMGTRNLSHTAAPGPHSHRTNHQAARKVHEARAGVSSLITHYRGGGKTSDLMAKGGEGSHGGHIIGHTKSGKPVYAPAKETVDAWHAYHHHPMGRDFADDTPLDHAHDTEMRRCGAYTAADHADAASIHQDHANVHGAKAKGKNDPYRSAHNVLAMDHRDAANEKS